MPLVADPGLWGDIPAWVSSASGLLALAFAAIAAVFARRAYQIESARDEVNENERRERAEAGRRAQASQISAWWGKHDGQWGIHVRNASGTPVYQAHAVARKSDDPFGGTKIDLPVIPPTENALFYPQGERPDQRVIITYTDSKGERWHRDEYGQLAELPTKLSIVGDQMVGRVFAQFKSDFHHSYGVDVTFSTNEWINRQDGYIHASRAGEIADVIYGHSDWIGNLVRHDVIEPVLMSSEQRATFTDWALEAMSYQGVLYGIPWCGLSPVLIRNTDLVPNAPATFDELIQIGQELVREKKVEHPFTVQVGPVGDVLHLSALYSSLGGRLFGRLPDGSWDFSRMCIADDVCIAALARIRDLGKVGLGALRTNVWHLESAEEFCQGRSPFVIHIDAYIARDADFRYAISPVPPFVGGLPPEPWSVVVGLHLAKRGVNTAVARDLVPDYLCRSDVVNSTLSMLEAVSPSRLSKPDTDKTARAQIFQHAVLMPNHPDIAKVWQWCGQAFAAVVDGADPATVTSREMV